MTLNLRRHAAAFLAAVGFALPASATTFGTDFTDLWFNPAESGWGVNVIQQSGTIFATLFVYGADNTPRWYVASDLRGNQSNSFTGALYQTTGPYFGTTWTGTAAVTAVGNMTLSFSGFNSGTLSYTVNGVPVNKVIQRQTFQGNNIAGNYIGGMTATATACSNSADNGEALITGLLTVTHSGNPSMRVDFRNNAGTVAQCTFTGPYAAAGRLATITGTFTCTLGSVGTFTLGEVDVGKNGFTATFTGRDQFCTYNGYFGGIKDVL